MQIIITVGEEGRTTAQVLGAAPIGEPVTYTAEAEEAAIDAGAGPAVGEELESESGPSITGMEPEALDGGAALPETQETEELPVGALSAETGAAEDAGAAPTISDIVPTESGNPMLKSID